MERKHSPLPWKLGRHTETSVESQDERSTASCGGYSDNRIEDGGLSENIANAAFIVRACNYHYDLVDALKETEKVYNELREYIADHGARDNALIAIRRRLHAAFSPARAALSRARGEA